MPANLESCRDVPTLLQTATFAEAQFEQGSVHVAFALPRHACRNLKDNFDHQQRGSLISKSILSF